MTRRLVRLTDDLSSHPTKSIPVYMANREGDLRELIDWADGLGHPADYLGRGGHDRALADGGRLRAEVERQELLGEMVRIVAGFGGFLGRKGDGHPGPKTL